MAKPHIAVIAGPTASGKTACAVALCQSLDGEVVSSDSMQLYLGMDIGTAKPTEDEKMGVPHHMIGVLEPTEVNSRRHIARMAGPVVGAISLKEALAVCARTGLYTTRYQRCVSSPYKWHIDVRNILSLFWNRMERKHSIQTQSVDAPIRQRGARERHAAVILAIEILRTTGVTLTGTTADAERKVIIPFLCARWNGRGMICIEDRPARGPDDGGRIGRRGRHLLENDARAAVRTAMQAIDTGDHGSAGRKCKMRAVARIKQATRNYAKRQLTWFRLRRRVNGSPQKDHGPGYSREITDKMERTDEHADFLAQCERIAKGFLKNWTRPNCIIRKR
jgi:tRNA dimethylallyltransferase